MTKELQAPTSGGSREGPPLFLHQIEAQRPVTPYLRVWMTVTPRPPFQKVWIRHCGAAISVGFKEVSVKRELAVKKDNEYPYLARIIRRFMVTHFHMD